MVGVGATPLVDVSVATRPRLTCTWATFPVDATNEGMLDRTTAVPAVFMVLICVVARIGVVLPPHTPANVQATEHWVAVRDSPSPGAVPLVRALAGVPATPGSSTHLRAHETVLDLVCRLLLETR